MGELVVGITAMPYLNRKFSFLGTSKITRARIAMAGKYSSMLIT